MFTGIIEATGAITKIDIQGSNKCFTLTAPFAEELQINQSISHNGVCLSVTTLSSGAYSVVAVAETLARTNLNALKKGDLVNLERCLRVSDRLDGHFVLGHVDTTAQVKKIEEKNGSWVFTFSYPLTYAHLLVEKGSVCLNGISLTVFGVEKDSFSVAIIPLTYERTNLASLHPGDTVNIEFDVLGKYVERLLKKS